MMMIANPRMNKHFSLKPKMDPHLKKVVSYNLKPNAVFWLIFTMFKQQ